MRPSAMVPCGSRNCYEPAEGRKELRNDAGERIGFLPACAAHADHADPSEHEVDWDRAHERARAHGREAFARGVHVTAGPWRHAHPDNPEIMLHHAWLDSWHAAARDARTTQ